MFLQGKQYFILVLCFWKSTGKGGCRVSWSCPNKMELTVWVKIEFSFFGFIQFDFFDVSYFIKFRTTGEF
jgi:hypothetical protein